MDKNTTDTYNGYDTTKKKTEKIQRIQYNGKNTRDNIQRTQNNGHITRIKYNGHNTTDTIQRKNYNEKNYNGKTKTDTIKRTKKNG
jgi:hypothetical protein